MITKNKPPRDDVELLKRCSEIAGLSFAALATHLACAIPSEPSKRKGWVGGVLERILGTTAGTLAKPDFHHLGIELKTLPMGVNSKPLESTFVTSIPHPT